MRTALVTIALLAAGSTQAATVVSTPAGGSWSDSATWVGGVVPGVLDDVVVAGPVTVPGTQACATLDVLAAGSLSGESGASRLDVADDVTNAGSPQQRLLTRPRRWR